MDIFTTQLTRVVPVPIMPVSTKVKALSKEARTRALEQETDHQQTPEYVRAQQKKLRKIKQQQDQQQQQATGQDDAASAQPTQANAATEQDTQQTKPETPHFDLFV